MIEHEVNSIASVQCSAVQCDETQSSSTQVSSGGFRLAYLLFTHSSIHPFICQTIDSSINQSNKRFINRFGPILHYDTDQFSKLRYLC
jgi:hypothetical protein